MSEGDIIVFLKRDIGIKNHNIIKDVVLDERNQ